MTSPYRPTLASGMTGSSVAHGFAGGTPLPQAPIGLNEKFDKPSSSHGTVTALGHPNIFAKGTHSYNTSGPAGHTTHEPRFSQTR